MNSTDKTRLERLINTFARNFEITRLYADYLENFPEAITRDMVDALTRDGDITKKDALVGIVSELFSLDYSNASDRILIRDYVTPSIRLLDAEKYRSNPYYKNIRLENVRLGSWEIRNEEYKPYRAVIASDMIINDDFSEIPPLGFFTEAFSFPAVLENGNEWMTLTPVDLDTSEEAIEAAHGKVVTFGLGLGYYAYMASEKEEVESVTVVELSPDVIELFKAHILPKMKNAHKIRIVNADAFDYAENIMPSENFDVAFVDTWRDASDGAPMYERMRPLEKLSPKTEFIYWIENFLRSRLRAQRFSELCDEYFKGGRNLSHSYDEIAEELQKI